MRATLGFLEKITRAPEEICAEDSKALQDVGISEQAIEDALMVCALFNIIDRLADAFDVRIPSPEEFKQTGERLLSHGYR